LLEQRKAESGTRGRNEETRPALKNQCLVFVGLFELVYLAPNDFFLQYMAKFETMATQRAGPARPGPVLGTARCHQASTTRRALQAMPLRHVGLAFGPGTTLWAIFRVGLARGPCRPCFHGLGLAGIEGGGRQVVTAAL